MKRSLVACVLVAVLGCAVAVTTWGVTLPGNLLLPVSSLQYRLVAEKAGLLSGRGDYDLFDVTLYSGFDYKLALSVPWGADFDFVVADENGNIVGSGDAGGRGVDEVVYVTPRWTGTFYIMVYSYSGSGGYTLSLWRRG